MKVHHIGYAVKNIDKAIKAFEAVGYFMEGSIIEDSIRNVKIAFLRNDELLVELVAPNGDNNPVSAYLTKGPMPYHICYSVPDIEKAMLELGNKGYITIIQKQPAVAIGNKNVVFMYSSSIGMIELVEE